MTSPVEVSPLRVIPGDATSRVLNEGWQLCLQPPAAEEHAVLGDAPANWIPARVPGTVAQALSDAEPDRDARLRDDLDAHDVWYRCEFRHEGGGRAWLQFDGLATVCDIWFNGQLLGESHNMFVGQRFDVTDRLRTDNELSLRFVALAPQLSARKPRPRWKTRLVKEQNLRWQRTTLLGRIPGWSPPCAPVGPWRAIRLIEEARLGVQSLRLHSTLDDGAGVLRVEGQLTGDQVREATVRVGEHSAALQVTEEGDGVRVSGTLRVPEVRPWAPHTLGTPHRYPVSLVVGVAGGNVELDAGWVGFRSVELRGGNDGEQFQIAINGSPVFCRGGCWTTTDVLGLDGDREAYAQTLERARDAGVNMIRVGGTMTYEADAFYELCDELGILVWQDFMFANMDYPIDDEAFRGSVECEARQQLERLSPHPCVTVWCGGSEVAQQAAMLGLPRETWLSPLFRELLPRLCEQHAAGIPYVPSTPWGGSMPFRMERGVSHYFGVGAYLRPLDDARITPPRFAAECLAFSIPPEDATLNKLLSDGQAPGHDPVYKQRVPRDSGAGWDFQDVTDHYVQLLFGVDVRQLRYENAERYMELSRVAVAEVMARTYGLWRAESSPCSGALIWFYRDLWQGSGWGVVDSTGLPKAPYYALRRAWSRLAVWFIDEGLNGVDVVLDNETDDTVTQTLEVGLYRDGSVQVDRLEQEVTLAPRSQQRINLEQAIGRFVDTTHAYRFGPAVCDVVTAQFGPQQAAFFPAGLGLTQEADLKLTASAEPGKDGSYVLDVSSERFAQAVAITAKGYLAEDNYFHMPPGQTRRIRLSPVGSPSRFSGRVKALNSVGSTRITVKKP